MKYKVIIILIIICAFIFLRPAPTGQSVLVTKVIDGDTIIIQGGQKVRLLGIDADERGEPCYGQAKDYLKQRIVNKYVFLEPDSQNKDKYGRLLRWVWLNDSLINLELVNKGLAIARFETEIKYERKLMAAEANAIKNKIGCKWSSLK